MAGNSGSASMLCVTTPFIESNSLNCAPCLTNVAASAPDSSTNSPSAPELLIFVTYEPKSVVPSGANCVDTTSFPLLATSCLKLSAAECPTRMSTARIAHFFAGTFGSRFAVAEVSMPAGGGDPVQVRAARLAGQRVVLRDGGDVHRAHAGQLRRQRGVLAGRQDPAQVLHLLARHRASRRSDRRGRIAAGLDLEDLDLVSVDAALGVGLVGRELPRVVRVVLPTGPARPSTARPARPSAAPPPARPGARTAGSCAVPELTAAGRQRGQSSARAPKQ